MLNFAQVLNHLSSAIWCQQFLSKKVASHKSQLDQISRHHMEAVLVKNYTD